MVRFRKGRIRYRGFEEEIDERDRRENQRPSLQEGAQRPRGKPRTDQQRREKE